MWRVRFLVCSMVINISLVGGASEAIIATGARYRFSDFDARVAVERAVHGAGRRLAERRCHSVIAEFADRQGLPLTEKLYTMGMTPIEYLGTLRFVEAPESAPCRFTSATVAFTAPGRRIVRVCPIPFKQLYRVDSWTAEFLIIHELLHTLGLGENPPTPQEITKRVKARCQ
jgi:hypothetical protein